MMKSVIPKSLRCVCSSVVFAGLGLLGGVSLAPAAVFTVVNTDDAGPGSLRDAITQANSGSGGDTITFTTNGVIRLNSSLPSLAQDVTITGPGATNLVINGQQAHSILAVEVNVQSLLSGLTFADGLGATGGGAAVNDGRLTLRGCIFANNAATNGGGAILNRGGLTIEACNFVSNRVVGLPGVSVASTNIPAGTGNNGQGGALFSISGLVYLTNCTFSGNEVIGGKGGDNEREGGGGTGGGGFGGAICFEKGGLIMVNCTLTGNLARGGAGGTVLGDLGPPGPDGFGVAGGFFSKYVPANANLLNTIIAGNSCSTNPAALYRPDVRGYLVSLGGNLVQDTNGLSTALLTNDIVNVSPLLAPLGDNGGPIPTHAFATNSPALDAGVAEGAALLDARGVIRPQGLGVDIGAYEWGNQAITFPAIPGTNYGAAPFDLNASSSSRLPVTLTVLSGPAQLSPTNNRQLIITGAGTVVVAAFQAGNVLYNPAPSVTNSCVVAKAPLTASAQTNASRPYGAANPAFTGTVTGQVNGDVFTAISVSVASATTPAGTYAPPSVYALTPVLSDPGYRLTNYTVFTNLGTLTISKTTTPLIVSANSASRPYGQANPTFSGTISNLLNGDAITASFISTAVTNTPAGTYGPTTAKAIFPVLNDPNGRLANYTVVTNLGTLTITKATAPIIVTANNASRRFAQPNPVFTGTLSNVLCGDRITATFSSAATLTTPAGVYAPPSPNAITPYLSDPDGRLVNYTVTATGGTLTIAPFNPPSVRIISPTNGSVFLVGMDILLMAEVVDTNGVIASVNFFDWNTSLGAPISAPPLYSLTVSNLTAGAHRFSVEVVDIIGRTNRSANVDVNILTSLPYSVGPIDTNSLEVWQTGLYFQDLWITNPTPVTLRGVRVEVRGLTNAWLWNATGTNAGGYVPYVQFNGPISGGQAQKLRFDYYVPDGSVPSPAFNVLWLSSDNPTNAAGTLVPIGRILPFANGTMLLNFTTVANQQYYIQYSSDMVTWNTSLPAVIGRGGVQQWMDYGPPLTLTHPANTPHRFYRLRLLPSN